MARLYDMAQMTVTSTGTGTITLNAAAVVGGVTYLTFSAAGALTGNLLSYRIVETANSNWEVGRGTYTAGPPITLTRGPLFSNNANAAIAMTASATVMIAPLAEDFNNTIALGLTASGQTLTAAFNELTTVAAAATVVLPTIMTPSDRCTIRNSGANPLTVNPGATVAINNLAVGAAMTISPDTTGTFQQASATRWYTLP